MTVEPATWRAIFERDRGICQYCEEDLLKTFSSYWSATVDHVKARAAGGDDSLDNLVCCCTACNSMMSRSNKLVTVDARREYVQRRRAEELAGYERWVKELRLAQPQCQAADSQVYN